MELPLSQKFTNTNSFNPSDVVIKKKNKTKPQLHPRNKHRGHYDFPLLLKSNCELSSFVMKHPFIEGEWTIDFSNPQAVKELNRALLFSQYNIRYWDFPKDQLCPPIPGRADYIHHLADLLKKMNIDLNKVRGIDIGVGANAIYSLLGVLEYQWSMLGVDVSIESVLSAKKIVCENKLDNFISIRQQTDKNAMFKNVIEADESFTFSICNPPFYSSKKEAEKTNLEKNRKLKISSARNFAGVSNELWFPGGELEFVKKMINESFDYKHQIKLFTVLISKKENLPYLIDECKKNKAKEIQIIEMGQGQKISRILAWTF